MMRSTLPRRPDTVRLRPTALSRLSSLLLGAALALVVVGALSAFASFSSDNLLIALFAALVGTFPGLLLVLLLEYLLLQSQKLQEIQKQRRLLEEIRDQIGERVLSKDY